MTEFYFIRHAQAEGNLYRMMQGHWDGGVTELGMRQIDALAERFKDVKIDALYSSDLRRARLTASAITRWHDVELRTDRRLREINVGPWETEFLGNAMHDSPETMRCFLTEPESFYLDGAETYAAVAERAASAIDDIAAAHPGDCVAVVSHGITLRCLTARLLGVSISDLERAPLFGNTGVAHLFIDGGVCRADYFNSTEHLTPELLAKKGVAALRDEPIDPREHEQWYKSCYSDAWLSAHGNLDGYNAETYFSCACAHCRADSGAVLTLFDGDRPAGLVDLDTERGAHANYGWISLLYLAPEYRGKGLGIQALARAIKEYRRLGRNALRLHVSEDNAAALAFYERWGFKRLSSEPGSGARLWLMEKVI